MGRTRRPISLVYVLVKVPVQERDDLRTCAARVRGERRFARTGGDAVGYCPRHGVSVVRAAVYVGKAADTDRRGTGCSPQESYNLGAGNCAV